MLCGKCTFHFHSPLHDLDSTQLFTADANFGLCAKPPQQQGLAHDVGKARTAEDRGQMQGYRRAVRSIVYMFPSLCFYIDIWITYHFDKIWKDRTLYRQSSAFSLP